MRTIRGKLTLAFLLIIAVCLIPTSAAATYVIRYYQRQDALERLGTYGQTVAGAAQARQFSQFSPAEIVNLFDGQKTTNTLVVSRTRAASCRRTATINMRARPGQYRSSARIVAAACRCARNSMAR